MEILENHKNEFSINFAENKKNLEQLSIIRSKSLKNKIAGYITKFLKHEMLDKKKQEERLARQTKIDDESPEENLDMGETKKTIQSQNENTTSEEPFEKISEQN